MPVVNKIDLNGLIRRKAEKTYTAAEVADIMESLAEVVEDEVKNGNEIIISDICRISYRKRDAHKGRNPSTGEELDIPEKMQLVMRPAASLKRLVADLNPDDFQDGDAEPAEPEEKPEADKPKRGKRKS